MLSDRPKLLTYLWRAGLIAVMAASILLAFGHRRVMAWLGPRAMPSAAPARAHALPPLAPFADATFLRSHECSFNGEKAVFALYRSARSPEEVIGQFEELYGAPTSAAPPTRGTMMRVVASGYAAAGAVDPDGYTVGIVAYGDPKTGGSTYYVGRSRPSDPKGWRYGDVPGDEVPGIPRPPNARRVFCVNGLGGIQSRLLVYEGAGSLDAAADIFVSEMPKAGWTRNTDAENIIQRQLEGKFLSFIQGTRRAMVYIERDPGTNKVRTAVAYAVKDWLPPDRGL